MDTSNYHLYYPERYNTLNWLPTTLKEVKAKGWEELDVILFSGDAYIDHPSFGAAVVARVLEKIGLRVALVPQPNWQDDLRDFKKLGEPKLFFGVTAGNMDSMINHYTANKRIRSSDAYSIGNKAGFRPDRAVSVYSRILRDLYPESIIVAGGIEASLRRLTHYDYWDDKLLPSILASAPLDYILYGMADKILPDFVSGVKKKDISFLRSIPQLAYIADSYSEIQAISDIETITLSSYESCLADKKAFAHNFTIIEENSNRIKADRLVQQNLSKYIVINPPAPLKSPEGLDQLYSLPYTRLPHPKYWKKPLIPAHEMIRFSINIHRGCFGGCSFCTISAHQGKFIENRSEESIITEINQVTGMPGFKGYLSDLGGPSANMFKMEGVDLKICDTCTRPSCIHPGICFNLNTNHQPLIELYRKVRKIKGIKKAFIGSGIRYDLFLRKQTHEHPSHKAYPEEIIKHHVSGRLKVAPEHTHDHVLKLMRKPSFSYFEKFYVLFKKIDKANGGKQQLIPYFISSHPGCKMEDMAELAVKTKEMNYRLQQVQELTPTPMTLSAVMYYTGIDPYTVTKLHTTQNSDDKKDQNRFFFWHKREEQAQIRRLLHKLNRKDLLNLLLPGHSVQHKRR